MIGIILFGFIGCMLCGWIIGLSDNDDKGTRIISYIMAVLMFIISIFVTIAWRDTIKDKVIFEHYNIIQEEITTTTYKIIPNG